MNQLLSIEQNFLNLPTVKQALNLQAIRSVQRTIVNAKKKKFEQTIELSKLVKAAVDWFNSEEGKAVCNEEGISWSNEEIGAKLFGWQKSYFYKVVKAGKLEESIIDTFRSKCDELEAQGGEPNRSLEGLLKFAKQYGSNDTDGGQGEESESGNDAEVETRTKTVFTMAFKRESGNVSVRIDADGKIKTSNTTDEIQEAIAFLQFVLNNQQA